MSIRLSAIVRLSPIAQAGVPHGLIDAKRIAMTLLGRLPGSDHLTRAKCFRWSDPDLDKDFVEMLEKKAYQELPVSQSSYPSMRQM